MPLLKILAIALTAILLLGPECKFARAQRYESFTTPTPLSADSVLIIGFLGGVEPWDADRIPVRRMALELRAMNLPHVYVETVENRHQKVALKLIRNALGIRRGDTLRTGDPAASPVELILYGHSLGGDAVVKLARELKKIGVPVRLTIQIDSVGMDDRTIPSNVALAINFYQRNGPLIRGRSEIRAEDPQNTKILGNFKFDYRHKDVDESALPWAARAVGGAHAKMECDPEVWARVRSLILEQIRSQPAPSPETSAQTH